MSTIPRSGGRFSEKDHAQTKKLDFDPVQSDRNKV
jgi:hypothetical protein